MDACRGRCYVLLCVDYPGGSTNTAHPPNAAQRMLGDGARTIASGVRVNCWWLSFCGERLSVECCRGCKGDRPLPYKSQRQQMQRATLSPKTRGFVFDRRAAVGARTLRYSLQLLAQGLGTYLLCLLCVRLLGTLAVFVRSPNRLEEHKRPWLAAPFVPLCTRATLSPPSPRTGS